MLAAVAPRAAAGIRDFEPQGLCNLLYGYAVLQQQLGPQLAEAAVVVVRDRRDTKATLCHADHLQVCCIRFSILRRGEPCGQQFA